MASIAQMPNTVLLKERVSFLCCAGRCKSANAGRTSLLPQRRNRKSVVLRAAKPEVSVVAAPTVPFDPLRDGPLRYLGYANELGEAFNAWLPAGSVPLSYAIAITYVLVDTADKGFTAKRESDLQLERKILTIPTSVNKRRLAAILAGERALDTVVWQMLASVAIPGFTIHQVVAITHAILHSQMQHLGDFEMQTIAEIALSTHTATALVLEIIDKMVPTLVGLFAIPFIVHPIDESVHRLLDRTLRPAMKDVICDKYQGSEAGLDVCNDPFMDQIDEQDKK